MKNKTGFLENFLNNKIAYFVTSNIHKFFEARNVFSEYKIATAKLKRQSSIVDFKDANDNIFGKLAHFFIAILCVSIVFKLQIDLDCNASDRSI